MGREKLRKRKADLISDILDKVSVDEHSIMFAEHTSAAKINMNDALVVRWLIISEPNAHTYTDPSGLQSCRRFSLVSQTGDQ